MHELSKELRGSGKKYCVPKGAPHSHQGRKDAGKSRRESLVWADGEGSGRFHVDGGLQLYPFHAHEPQKHCEDAEGDKFNRTYETTTGYESISRLK